MLAAVVAGNPPAAVVGAAVLDAAGAPDALVDSLFLSLPHAPNSSTAAAARPIPLRFMLPPRAHRRIRYATARKHASGIAEGVVYTVSHAALRSDCQSASITFMLVGPLVDPERAVALQAHANVIFPGMRPYAEVPAYIAAFDLCLIPFISGKIAESTNPVKVFEYFALGKPVLSTPVAELQSFAQEGLLTIAEGEEFIRGLERAGEAQDPAIVARRKEIAAAQSWQALVAQMLEVMNRGEERP